LDGSNTLSAGLLGVSRPGVRKTSLVSAGDAEFGMTREERPRLAILAKRDSRVFSSFGEGEASAHGGGTLLLCPTSVRNAAALRESFAWLEARTLGVGTSAGFGDRLGLATPGHVRAVRAAGGDLAPIFAQQSIREMERTGRTPRQVMDDATWGVFAEGWRGGFGADADHLKTSADVDSCVAAGYTFFTFDPGDHVDDAAEGAGATGLRAMLDRLPWDLLEDTGKDLFGRYAGRRLDLGGHDLALDEAVVARAAAKYGRAVAHATALYRHLERAMGDRPFEVEVSVDETASPTTHAQHLYIANELSRLGVTWVSLAPRYVGRFEKGVDYLGDVARFEADFAAHAAIARRFGPYKLSLHSGSDKFSIYPAAVRQTRGLVHLKTAGTSYLEALRTVAALDADLFREIYAFAHERYEEDRASYHVSASLEKAAAPGDVVGKDLPALLDRFDEREILHVTFGSVLTREDLRDRLMGALVAHPEDYAENLEKHFLRHLESFAAARNDENGGNE
jgi:tagaturonate epimerase